ncbi:ORC1-type DNA replication protein [Metallosphaera hakonensis]|uniref:ORC1-type DNA replication protein n=1 Tax=Metallosphaera hakonensis JCM 8857 = DSM 7519 TaxID=1293036 RepID=A0A2U9IUC4_9CREN|nr:ORC1-type DNA replication protein [Metallosphaera hakonensis]AWR99681.1 ORC1-type DNA replication protein [Metallosphaera hakonensis JCM 8857 = DSM 7519]
MKVTTKLEDIIESGLSESSIFKRREALQPEHIPSRLPHREDKIRELTLIFRDLTTSIDNTSIRVVISGHMGTGKTVTTKSFGKAFKDKLSERGLRLEYVHVNCHRQRTLYPLVMEIASSLKLPIPTRGLSVQEAFKIIHDYLVKRNVHLILALDEFDYLIKTASQEDIYFLVRLYDELSSSKRHISYIFIMRDEQDLSILDRSIKDHIIRNIIRFEPYGSGELKDILTDRVNEAFQPNVVQEETISYISEIYGRDKGGSGNARSAIETLEMAGKIAEIKNSPSVLIEHAKEANSRINVEAGEVLDEIPILELHPLIILKAIINLHNRLKVDSVPMGKLEKEYADLCAELGEEPRGHTQLYEHVRRMKLMGILETQQSGKGMRGRTTLISLAVPITGDLEELINRTMRSKIDNREEPL